MTIVNTQIDHPKKISGLIQDQFPAFYRDEGPVFVDFVKAYYDWMEDRSSRVNKKLNVNKASVNVAYNNTTIQGNNTLFTTWFSNGDSIALYRSDDDYELFTINVVSNNTVLTLDSSKVPTFALSNAAVGNVFVNTNPGYYPRRTLETMDIDKTAAEFVVYFKEQFLKNIQFSTITDTRTMIKNSLDLYRSKGTPRSVDLLFKVAFGVPADVYYPSIDLFNTSFGDWTVPRYLELSLSPISRDLVNKQIMGLTSEATAFCDAVVRREINGRLLDVAYISAIQGEWQTGEVVVDSLGLITDKESAPTVVGSLNKIIVVESDEGFSIGDTLNVTSNTGHSATVRVANITNTTGSVSLSLIDGGYGYSTFTNTYISEKIIKVQGVSTNVGTSDYIDLFEYVEQPTSNAVYSAGTGTWNVGDDVFTYYGNGSVDGTGAILAVTAVNGTYGEMTLKTLSGNMNSTFVGGTSNTVNATIDTYTNTASVARVLGAYDNVALQVYDSSGTFTVGEIVTGTTQGNGLFQLNSNTSGPNSTILITNSTYAFVAGETLTGADSGATATIAAVDIEIGVLDITNDFTIIANNFLTSNTRIVNGEVTFISAGSGMTVAPATNFLYTEFVNVCTTLLTVNTSHYMPIALNAAQYDLPGDVACNLTSNTIENSLTFANIEIGKIQTLTGVSSGSSYNRNPIIKFLDPWTYPHYNLDTKYVTIANTTTDFSVGELVTQVDNSFRGIVETANTTELRVQRLRFFDANDVVVTTNTTTTLVGEDSGAVANVTAITTSMSDDYIGLDAEIGLETAIANGVVTEFEVTDSGFGFLNGQSVTIGDQQAFGLANVYTYGAGAGFYRSKDSFLSDIKVLQDGMFWQTHSYEVRASVALDKYENMLKEVVHVAGTQYFGNLVLTSTSDIIINGVSNTITGTNTVITTAIVANSIQDRFGDFIYDYQGNNITTRV